MVTEHDNDVLGGLLHQANEAIKKCFAVKIEKSFWTSHSAGGSGREDNSGDHFNSALRFSCAKMDLESDRQSEFGARRIAIISATTETAISSGDSAPISKPMG